MVVDAHEVGDDDSAAVKGVVHAREDDGRRSGKEHEIGLGFDGGLGAFTLGKYAGLGNQGGSLSDENAPTDRRQGPALGNGSESNALAFPIHDDRWLKVQRHGQQREHRQHHGYGRPPPPGLARQDKLANSPSTIGVGLFGQFFLESPDA